MKCILCGKEIAPDFYGWEFGHNPEPLAENTDDSRCCTTCNMEKVIPERLRRAGIYI